jgi:hypothetical protein
MVTLGMGSMMGGHHQITMTEPRPGVPVPSEELIESIIDEANTEGIYGSCMGTCIDVAKLAYAAGAHEQLRLCVEWLEVDDMRPHRASRMQTAMRSGPPSLKEQALKALRSEAGSLLSPKQWGIIVDAVESLPG